MPRKGDRAAAARLEEVCVVLAQCAGHLRDFDGFDEADLQIAVLLVSLATARIGTKATGLLATSTVDPQAGEGDLPDPFTGALAEFAARELHAAAGCAPAVFASARDRKLYDALLEHFLLLHEEVLQRLDEEDACTQSEMLPSVGRAQA